jgi:gamma-glutamyltranspeptidase/glutathione hydrolase
MEKMTRSRRKSNNVDTDFMEPERVKVPQPQRISASRLGMVATAHFEATRAGVSILEAGGNAMDAAVGAAFALGVCEPQASGLGGQTMMLLHVAETGQTLALDGSSRAPNRAVMESLLEKSTRLLGYGATTVPSTPATLAYVLDRYGTLSLKHALKPAIDLAENGFQITQLQRKLQKRELANFKKGNAASLFLRGGDKPYTVGRLFKQPVLAKTLERLAEGRD